MQIRLQDDEWVSLCGPEADNFTIWNTGSSCIAYVFARNKPDKKASEMNEDDYYKMPPGIEPVTFDRVEYTGIQVYATSMSGVGWIIAND